MIEIQCPACGAGGRVPKEKFNTRLVCKKCLKAFHITPSGRAVLGEPPIVGAGGAALSHEHPADPTQDVDQWFEKLSRTLFSTRTIAYTLVGLALFIGTLVYSFRRPDTLQDRAARLAQAAFSGDLQAVRSMSASGTMEEAVQWYQAVRPILDNLQGQIGGRKLNIQVEVRQQPSDPGLAGVIAHIAPEESLARTGASLPDPVSLSVAASTAQSVALPMAWRNEGWAGWKLDGKRSLADAVASLP
jgi:hypothetical protein